MKLKLFFLFAFLNTTFCVKPFAQTNSRDTLSIESVDFKILTFASISCDNFSANFKNRVKASVIIEKDTIRMLNFYLSKVKYARKSRDIDIRAKFIYERENKAKVTICTNGYEVLVDGKLIKRDIKFVDFLRGLTM